MKRVVVMRNNSNVDRVLLEIPAEKLSSLMAEGFIYPSDIRCLDLDSKECVQNLCLQVCTKRLNKV